MFLSNTWGNLNCAWVARNSFFDSCYLPWNELRFTTDAMLELWWAVDYALTLALPYQPFILNGGFCHIVLDKLADD